MTQTRESFFFNIIIYPIQEGSRVTQGKELRNEVNAYEEEVHIMRIGKIYSV